MLKTIFAAVALTSFACSAHAGAYPARGTVELTLVADGMGGVRPQVPPNKRTAQYCVWQEPNYDTTAFVARKLFCDPDRHTAYDFYWGRYPGAVDTAVILLAPDGTVLYARSLDTIPGQ